MSRPDIAVVIPTHPARLANGMLTRALESVYTQTLPAAEIHIAVDLDAEGAPDTRQRALQAVQAEWTAFLDSDDAFNPDHLAQLYEHAQATGADYVYSHYEVVGGTDPRPWMLDAPFDPENPDQTTVTILVRTELAKRIEFRNPGGPLTDPGRYFAGEDWDFTQRCVAVGARIEHLAGVRSWRWFHHSMNSSGIPQRGDA